jgi:two-component system CheB/CheR fusion protein
LFATDIDRRAIETARAGVYASDIASHVSARRLSKYFDRDDRSGGYRIKKQIRDMLIFSEQDVVRDPPFSRLDVISCRNLLIYLGGELQKKLIPLFHYALNPQGVLLLGTSETTGNFIDLFTPLDRKAKIYRKKSGGGDATAGHASAYNPPRPYGRTSASGLPGGGALRVLAEKILLQHIAAAAVLVNESGDILYIHGRTGGYLEPSPGDAGMNILKMARDGLRHVLTGALRNVRTNKKPVSYPDVRVITNGELTLVKVTVRPMPHEPGAEEESPLLLVIIEEAPGTAADIPSAVPPGGTGHEFHGTAAENRKRIATLKQELRIKDEFLQTTVEELNSSNEELQSINEELQSSNEELETSKEELQSVNEELATVNAELQSKVADLTRTNNDMNNLLAGTGIGTVFIDNQMCIRRFTPAVTSVINLIPTDIGRPLNHIVSNLVGFDHLMDEIQSVLSTRNPKEAEVETRTGARYLLRILPYRTLENVIEGVVITFIDIATKTAVRSVEP